MFKCTKYEFIKVFITKRLIYLLLFFIAIEIYRASKIEMYTPYVENQENKEFVDNLFEKYGGKLTKEKEKEIEKLIELYDQDRISDDIFKVQTQYEEGKISKSEYIEQQNENKGLLKKVTAFGYFAQDYEYVQMDEEREILNPKGWDRAFRGLEEDWFLIIYLILIAVTVASMEDNNDMNTIIKTTVEGKRKVIGAKLIIVLGSTIVLYSIAEIINLLAINRRMPLSDGKASIKCLEMYESFRYDMSLRKMLLVVLVLNILAYLLTTMLAFFITRLLKKAYIGIILTLAGIEVPYFLFAGKAILYKLPFQVSGMKIYGYFIGLCDGKEYIITMNNVWLNIGMIIFICIVMGGLTWVEYIRLKKSSR